MQVSVSVRDIVTAMIVEAGAGFGWRFLADGGGAALSPTGDEPKTKVYRPVPNSDPAKTPTQELP
jgi:hypothetical protein